MVGISGLGTGIDLDLEGAFYKAIDLIHLMLTYSYDKASGFVTFITSHFHYDRPREILALSLGFFVGVVVLVGMIGGAGMHGISVVDGDSTNLFGLSTQGLKIGSDASVEGIAEGARLGKLGATTSIAPVNITPNATTTLTDDLSCETNADCAVRFPMSGGFGEPFCCPPVGDCAGFCNGDCVPNSCENVCLDYDNTVTPPVCELWGCKEGTQDFGDCVSGCLDGSCIKSTTDVYLVSPANETTQNNDSVVLDWVSA